MIPRCIAIVAGLSAFLAPQLGAQREVESVRPMPYPIPVSRGLARAIAAGTRTTNGAPGPKYWQQGSRYGIRATLNADENRLEGEEDVWYFNKSPDTLSLLKLYLNQNANRPDGVRTEPSAVTSGMSLSFVSVRGASLDSGGARNGYTINGTVLTVPLHEVLLPDDSIKLSFRWAMEIPGRGDPHMGQDGEVFFLGYWYPQFAVYDDVSGWQADQYLVKGEFYMGFADYDVSLVLPRGWLAGATGALVNPSEVLSPRSLGRMGMVSRSCGVVQVVTREEAGVNGGATREAVGRQQTWHFRSTSTRDFAWGTSPRYQWDATCAVVGKNDTVVVNVLHRPEAVSWSKAADYAKRNIQFMSRELGPYPYSHFTLVEGLLSGGMEYPAIALLGAHRDTVGLFRTIAHEVAHEWFPMLIGSDERRFAWQDEGFATFLQGEVVLAELGTNRDVLGPRERYLAFARTDSEVAIMRPHDQFPVGSPASVVASYYKMATVLHMLRQIVGQHDFAKGLLAYRERWAFKLPQPSDFWNTIATTTGRNLDWFWRSWQFETWSLDQAIGRVTAVGDSVEIRLEDRGLVPMPVYLRITRADGSVQGIVVPVEKWFQSDRGITVKVQRRPEVVEVEIDPEQALADINRGNQKWAASPRRRE